MMGYRVLVTDATPPWKQATVFATIQSLGHKPGSDPRMLGVWMALAVPLFGATALAWYRRAGNADGFPRLLAVALLAILVVNPYAYFYDAVLLVPAAVLLWTRRDAYGYPELRRAAMGVTLATWAWMHLQFFVLRSSAPSLVGVGLTAWLLIELADLLRLARPDSSNPTSRPVRTPAGGPGGG